MSTVRPFPRAWPLALALAASVALGPDPVHAQATAGGGRSTHKTGQTTVTVVGGRSLNSACSELVSSPTALVRAPEGRALIRLQKDMDVAAATLPARGDVSPDMQQHMLDMRRTLDSLLRFAARTMTVDTGNRSVIVLRSPDGRQDVFQARIPAEARGQLEVSIRTLEPQIAALMAEAGRRTIVRVPSPAGWLGVTLSHAVRELPSPAGMLTYYCAYPVIEAVTPGSPAERAGLAAGDTVVAFNGRDVRAAAVNMAELLVPNRPLRVRVRRDGRSRETSLTVAARPGGAAGGAAGGGPSATTVPKLGASYGVVPFGATCVPGESCDRSFVVRMDTSGSVRVNGFSGPRPPVPPVDVLLNGTGLGLVLGARMSVVDEELARRLELKPGVLVLAVPPGSMAADAGLRTGDVILTLNGEAVRDVSALRRASDARELRLTVQGKGERERTIVVRW